MPLRLQSPASTWAALALVLGFVAASVVAIEKLGQPRADVEAGARALRILTALQEATTRLTRARVLEPPPASRELAAARDRQLLKAWDEARSAVPAEAAIGVDLRPTFNHVDAAIERLREVLLDPESPPPDRPPHRSGGSRDALALELEIGESLAGAIRQLRAAMSVVSTDMADAIGRARVLLGAACGFGLLLALTVVLRRRSERSLVRAQDRLIDLAARLDLLLERVPAVLWSTDRDLVFTTSGGAGLCELGLEPGQVVGISLYDYLRSRDPEFLPIAAHLRALEGESTSYETEWKGRWFSARVIPQRGEGGAIAGTLGVALDVTELKAARAALASSEARVSQLEKMEAIGRLASVVAHDFNNFLTVVLGYAGFLHDHMEPDAPLRPEVEEIVRTCERATKLSRQLLAFARRRGARRQPVEIDSIVRGVRRILERQCGPDIELVTQLAESLPAIVADPSEIEQLLVNLTLNARDAMPGGGRLEITTERGREPGGEVVLLVRDTGKGMDESTRARLFEPFFTTKDEASGTGIGLAIVFSIVQECGGSIRVDSAPGQGTSFRIAFPASAEPAVVEPLPEPVPAADGGSETILVVEDDDAVRAFARRALEAHGYTVLEARSGREALERAADGRGAIHLLLTDRRMPRMSGAKLAREVALLRPETRVLVMSTHPLEELADSADGVALPFLSKPFTSGELLRHVRGVLDGAPLATA